MTNLTEVSNFDATVYQIETTDPVVGGAGGIANLQAQSLADRTRYLYNLLNAVIDGDQALTGWAPLVSPALSGSPTAPNLAAGDNSTKIANSAFVQGAVNGLANVNVAGGANVALTAAQWGLKLVKLTGVLTANIAVIFPTQSGWWIVENATTGAFSVTTKTAAGTGIVVAQGAQNTVWGDGTNILAARTDFTSITLSGNTAVSGPLNIAGAITSSGNNAWTGANTFSISPTAPTPTRGTLTGALATMQALGGAFPSSPVTLTASTSIDVSYNGQFVIVGPASGVTQTLPAPSSVPGMSIGFAAKLGSNFTLASASSSIVGDAINGTSVSVGSGQYIVVQSDGSIWRVFSASPGLLGYTLLSHMGQSGGAFNSGGPNISATVSFTPVANGIVVVNGALAQNGGAISTASFTVAGGTTLSAYGNTTGGADSNLGVSGQTISVTAGVPVTITYTMTGTGTSTSFTNIGFTYVLVPTS